MFVLLTLLAVEHFSFVREGEMVEISANACDMGRLLDLLGSTGWLCGGAEILDFGLGDLPSRHVFYLILLPAPECAS